MRIASPRHSRNSRDRLLRRRGNDLNLDIFLAGFCDVHCLALKLESLHEIWIKVSELFEGFPGEDFVVSWGNSQHCEAPALVGERSFVELRSIAYPIRHEDGSRTLDGLLPVMHTAYLIV